MSKFTRSSGGWYILVYVANTAMGFGIIPLVIMAGGASAWGAVALAQTIGNLFAVLIAFGWGTTGALTVAGLNSRLRRSFLRWSALVRCTLFALCVPLIVLAVSSWGTGADRSLALLAAIGAASYALGANWYLVGLSKPLSLLALDVAPRALAYSIGLVLTLVWNDATGLIAAIGLGNVTSALLTMLWAYRDSQSSQDSLSLPSVLRMSTPGLLTHATTTAYLSVPMLTAQVVAPALLPQYATAERLLRAAVSASAPLLQAAQGYVGASTALTLLARTRRTLVAFAIIATVAMIGYGLFATPLSVLLSGGEAYAAPSVILPLAVACGAIVMSSSTGLVALVAIGRQRSLAISTLSAAAVGVPLTVFMGTALGLGGIATAMAITETAVVAIQLAIFKYHTAKAASRG